MIRLATEGDARAMARIYAPIVSGTAISFELVAPSEAQMAARVGSTLAYAPWLVAQGATGVWGFAYASRHAERAAYQWSVNVSVYVDDHWRRRGVGRALYTSLLALLRLQGFYAAHAGITLPNPGSVGLHEGLGFQPVGVYRSVGYKLGSWHDVGWWQLALRERTGEPTTLLSLAEARRAVGFEEALAAGRPLLRL
jgi:L-amino acid N-acyltransferase YncA